MPDSWRNGFAVRRRSRNLAIAVVVLLVIVGTGVAIAASMTLTTSHLGSAQVTTPPLFPDSLSLTNANGPGHNPGRVDNGDKITVVYSRPLLEPSICSSWTGTGNQTGTTIEVDVNKAAGATGNDTVTLLSSSVNVTCTSGFHFGTIDLGGTGFCTTAICTYAKVPITLTQTASSSTLLFTLTAIKSGTGGTANTARVATYTPDTALQDTASHSIGANLAASPSEVQF